jgi:hypothetical protein
MHKIKAKLSICGVFIGISFLCCPEISKGQARHESSLTFDGVQVTPVSYHIQNGFSSRAKVVLKFENVTNARGDSGNEVFVAANFKTYNEYSAPYVNADLSDGSGCVFNDRDDAKWVEGLSAGKNAEDWLRMSAGGSAIVAYSFKCYQIDTALSPPLALTAVVWIHNPRMSQRPQKKTLYFDNIPKMMVPR